MAKFETLFSQSINNPEAFWAKAQEGIDWYEPWKKVLDSCTPPFSGWFEGAKMNTHCNAIDAPTPFNEIRQSLGSMSFPIIINK